MQQEYFDFVQKGFRILVEPLSGFVGQKMSIAYGQGWWNEVLYVIKDHRNLPEDGTYAELVDSLDISKCIQLIDREWNGVFTYELKPEFRSYAKELIGVRNIVSHIGTQDLEQPVAERALDTMVLLCEMIDRETAEEIREIYKTVRSRAGGVVTQVIYEGPEQPESRSSRGALDEGSLLKLVGTDLVQKTNGTYKVTFGGKTETYPVYRVRLDALYYNDQNDRIATGISHYESENGAGSLKDLDRDIYNRIIENFIYESNPAAIRQTQGDIILKTQKVPGVTLADGRVVDGNRRFTCLRRIQRDSGEPQYFETVLMDMDIRADEKLIKQLELSLQFGEEKRLDYDLIDHVVGTYRTVEQNRTLTAEEYAASANEPLAEVKKRLDIARLIVEFLDYLHLPEQYYVAKEYNVYSLFNEMLAPLKKLDADEQAQLKAIAFSNAVIQGEVDQRKFIRDIKNLIKAGAYQEYFAAQKEICETIQADYANADIETSADINAFATEHDVQRQAMQTTMERALLRSQYDKLKSRPAENVARSIELLDDIDPRFFGSMDEGEKTSLMEQLTQLEQMAQAFRRRLSR